MSGPRPLSAAPSVLKILLYCCTVAHRQARDLDERALEDPDDAVRAPRPFLLGGLDAALRADEIQREQVHQQWRVKAADAPGSCGKTEGAA